MLSLLNRDLCFHFHGTRPCLPACLSPGTQLPSPACCSPAVRLMWFFWASPPWARPAEAPRKPLCWRGRVMALSPWESPALPSLPSLVWVPALTLHPRGSEGSFQFSCGCRSPSWKWPICSAPSSGPHRGLGPGRVTCAHRLTLSQPAPPRRQAALPSAWTEVPGNGTVPPFGFRVHLLRHFHLISNISLPLHTLSPSSLCIFLPGTYYFLKILTKYFIYCLSPAPCRKGALQQPGTTWVASTCTWTGARAGCSHLGPRGAGQHPLYKEGSQSTQLQVPVHESSSHRLLIQLSLIYILISTHPT